VESGEVNARTHFLFLIFYLKGNKGIFVPLNRKPAAASAPPPSLFVRVSAPGTGGIATYVLDGWGLASKLAPMLRTKRG
jgi:hypothetical protein